MQLATLIFPAIALAVSTAVMLATRRGAHQAKERLRQLRERRR